MAYTPATVIPTNQKYFTWYIPGGGIPRLTAPFSSTDTAIHWSVAPTDHTGAIITGGFHMNIQGDNGVSIIYVPTGAVDVDGLGATGVIHGWYEGLDYTTTNTVNEPIDHGTDDVVSCCISPVLQFIDHSALIGNVGFSATGIPYYASAPTFTPGSNQFASVTYVDDTAFNGAPDATTTTKGISKMSVAPVSATSPIAVGDNDGRVPTQAENNALVGNNTDIAVGSGNTFVTQTGLQHNAEKYAADSGGSDTYAITLSPVPTSYTDGMVFYFKANTANTGAATLNVNSLGAKTIKKWGVGGKVDLSTADIQASQFCEVIYDGTDMILLSAQQPRPLYGFGQGSRVSGAGTGTQTVAHGLGVIPRLFKVWYSGNNGNNQSIITGSGASDGTNYSFTTNCASSDTNTNGTNTKQGTNAVIKGYADDGSTALITATVSAIDATNVTLNFTTLTIDCYFQWEAFA